MDDTQNWRKNHSTKKATLMIFSCYYIRLQTTKDRPHVHIIGAERVKKSECDGRNMISVMEVHIQILLINLCVQFAFYSFETGNENEETPCIPQHFHLINP